MPFQIGVKKTTIDATKNWLDPDGYTLLPNGVVLDDDKWGYEDTDNNYRKLIPSGTVLGKITSSGKYRRCTQGTINKSGGYAAEAVEIVLDDALPFVAGDTILIQAADDSWLEKVISEVDYSTNTITVTVALGAVVNDNAAVKGNDGSQEALYFLEAETEVTNGDAMATAIDEGRVYEARLPYTMTDAEKTYLLYNFRIL